MKLQDLDQDLRTKIARLVSSEPAWHSIIRDTLALRNPDLVSLRKNVEAALTQLD